MDLTGPIYEMHKAIAWHYKDTIAAVDFVPFSFGHFPVNEEWRAVELADDANGWGIKDNRHTRNSRDDELDKR